MSITSASSAPCGSLQVEELALQSMIQAGEENVPVPLAALAEDTQQVRGSLGSEGAHGWG